MSDYPPLDFEDEVRFGKYKGSTVAEIIDDDPQYMVYLLGQGCGFTPDVEREIQKYVR